MISVAVPASGGCGYAFDVRRRTGARGFRRRDFVGAAQPRRRGWLCPACSHVSVDPRRVCGVCLAVEPGVVMDDLRGGVVDDGNGAVGWRCGNHGVSEDPMVRILTLPHGRCYRLTAAAAEPHGGRVVGSTGWVKAESSVERRGGDAGPWATASYTHFVSLPIGKLPAVRANATLLLEAMRHRCVDPTAMVTDDIFTTASRMHITLLMLSLPTQAAVALAKVCMQALEKKIRTWQETPRSTNVTEAADDECGVLQIHLGGLHVMKGRGRNEKKADVLYMGLADAASTSLLATLQKLVHECFAELTVNDPYGKKQSELLHMTLLNTKWRGGEATQEGCGAVAKPRPRISFDATHIRQEFGHVTLSGGGTNGAIVLECVELNALHYDSERECYPCECVIAM
ncbi:hypothetical protein TraAM80_10465 [Trypanosoma rangeli]|uniref:A-kinase anchor protein 7-like phosphoesterase domain-containing protein n=1 Tax=Trypanosoma rangeli TaxID=5698 RepID=A0A422MP50_TRYRA|nr:uncharacterized protein TraAM80_10465 [Trypanosoma rangeli]RNE94982.1 hypothetical protein TraAM80_10465 [Trypanosoma rangeli]|eukprot:RNE94982.1 hypothetical protein TraAM80_10465 [Trypanosoma rangeli]